MAYSRLQPSPRYRDLNAQYRRMHTASEPFQGIDPKITFLGLSLLRHAARIRALLRATQCESVLDYGCGKGRQYELRNVDLGPDGCCESIADYWDAFVHCYDPAFPPFSTLPAGTFNAVISTDVLEHCPEEDVPWILDEMFGYADRLVFANVACYPAKQHLPSGENAHTTVRPGEWWLAAMEQAAARHPALVWELSISELVQTADGPRSRARCVGTTGVPE